MQIGNSAISIFGRLAVRSSTIHLRWLVDVVLLYHVREEPESRASRSSKQRGVLMSDCPVDVWRAATID
jgi:hypothetical protein